jgi:hypothetical protein
MKRVILCRAFGDFIIALNAALHSKQPHQFQLVASSHLKPLYDAIPSCLFKQQHFYSVC